MSSSPRSTAGADQPMEVAVVGVGRMGRHHARVWQKVPGARLVGVVDAQMERAVPVASEYGCGAYADVGALLQAHPRLGAASVAVTTVYHVPAAQPLLERGIACLVEKPLAATVAQARQLVALAQRHQAVLQVGHIERFNPAFRAAVALGWTPRFVEAQRISPMTFRSLDVGVVMDMMIHDVDLVLALFGGSQPTQVQAVGTTIIARHEDMANVRLEFAPKAGAPLPVGGTSVTSRGGVANLIASRMALKTDRRLRFFAEQGLVSLDLQLRQGFVIRKNTHAAALADIQQRLARGEDLSSFEYAKLVQVEPLAIPLPPGEDDPLTAQLISFARAARGKHAPVVDGAAGLAAVETAQAILAALKA